MLIVNIDILLRKQRNVQIRSMLGGLSKEIPHSVTSYDKQGYIGTFSHLNPTGLKYYEIRFKSNEQNSKF